MADKGEIFTINELSEDLKTPKNTIYWLTCKKRIPFFKVGKQLRFRKSAIDKWAERQEVKGARYADN